MTVMTTRRDILAGAAGLLVAVSLPVPARAQSGAAAAIQGTSDAGFAPNAFIRIAADNTVTILIKHLELGQGAFTGLATLVADELDADWGQVRAEHAPADVKKYANLMFGMQAVGGSTGLANSYTQMRQAGAAARAMLVEAAGAEWGVPVSEISVSKGEISHAGSGRSAPFGTFADAAGALTPPAEPKLKTPDAFVYIGKATPRLDSAAKSTGAAIFTIDKAMDGMETVVIAHPPRPGAKVATLDASAAEAMAGVARVTQVPQGVAVYASDMFTALKARDALKITWDESGAEQRSSEEMYAAFSSAARSTGTVAEQAGDVDAALATAATTLEAEYLFPYLAHAPLEPLDGVITLKDGTAQVWLGSQLQTVDQQVIAGVLGIAQDQVAVNTMLAGGSFGRRAQPASEFAAELAALAKAGGDGTYKLVWTREDDITGGYYRPLTVHRLRGGLDGDGNIVAWENVVANQSILEGSPFEAVLVKDGIDATSIEGSRDLPYALPNMRVSWQKMTSPMPVLWWRSVGHTHTAYATETFLDELLTKAGKDPVEGRLALLKDDRARERAVLERVAEISGWSGAKAGQDRARGVALHKSFNSYVAMVAEVSQGDEEGLPRVHKLWVAIDCGVAVNPDIVRAQIEGGSAYGLSAAFFEEITLREGGRIAQSNFDTYRVLRMGEMPEIEVSIIDSAADPTGVGEPGTPPAPPAVANAWRALTGTSVRRLPFVAPVV